MTISARALAAGSWGNSVPLETRQSPYAAAMATAAFKAFLVSSSNLISVACGNGGPNHYNIGMKKSSIDGNRYLYFCESLEGLSCYNIIGGVGIPVNLRHNGLSVIRIRGSSSMSS